VAVTPAGQRLVHQAVAVVEREDTAFFAHGGAIHKPFFMALKLLADG
jgi:hypothetical protein